MASESDQNSILCYEVEQFDYVLLSVEVHLLLFYALFPTIHARGLVTANTGSVLPRAAWWMVVVVHLVRGRLLRE